MDEKSSKLAAAYIYIGIAAISIGAAASMDGRLESLLPVYVSRHLVFCT